MAGEVTPIIIHIERDVLTKWAMDLLGAMNPEVCFEEDINEMRRVALAKSTRIAEEVHNEMMKRLAPFTAPST